MIYTVQCHGKPEIWETTTDICLSKAFTVTRDLPGDGAKVPAYLQVLMHAFHAETLS